MNHKPEIPLADFNEAEYLRLNPDISNAVERGDFTSGWEHYLRFGINEERPRLSQTSAIVEQLTKSIVSIPVPPPVLRTRVHGAEATSEFHKIGKVVALDLESTIYSHHIQLGDRSNILDFGCGCGRIITWFQNLYPQSKFYGTDIDGEAIAWCQSNLANRGEFLVNKNLPPLPFADDFFDLVYSISIFTHLPEEMQFVWLKELNRVCRKGAYLLLTVHGAHCFPVKTEEAKAEFAHNGFYYLVGDGTSGLPEFYQNCYHTEAYIRDRWSDFFEIRQIVTKGVANFQDLVICSNK